MDKIKMELIWNNCKTCPPPLSYHPYLIYTDGRNVEACSYYKKYGFPIIDSELDQYWWTDLRTTIRESNAFKEALHENY